MYSTSMETGKRVTIFGNGSKRFQTGPGRIHPIGKIIFGLNHR